MARKKAATQSLSVAVLLNEAQRASASGHLRYAKSLWENQEEDTQGTFQQLMFALKLFMSVPEKNIYQDRLLRFLATFASQVHEQGQLDFLEAVIGQLVELSCAKDHSARWRACQLVQCMMGSLPGDAALADDVADAVQDAMLERLEDAKPNVRASAVRALARLPMPDDDGDFSECPVTAALLALLAGEKSKEVRKAVLASLPAARATTAHLLDRTRDEGDDVRRVAYLAIAEKVPVEELGATESALLLRRGLGDRARPVSDAAAAMAGAWLEGGCGGDPLALLRRLDAERHPEEAEMALVALMEAGRLDAVQVGKLAAEGGVGLRRDFAAEGAALMGPEEALFWRVVCERLASEAASKGLAAAATAGANASIEAAAAGDRLEALEAALPASVEEMVGVIAAHASGGAAHRFAAGQLMALAARCMDFTDATGRRAAAQLLEGVLCAEDGGGEEGTEAADAWREAAALLLRKVHAAPAELADAMLSVLGRLHAAVGFAEGAADEAAWLRALRAAALMLEQLPTARVALAAASPFSLSDLLHALIQPGSIHDSPAVRQEAVRCLGLYCLLDGIPTSLPGHLAVLRSVLSSTAQPLRVRAVAAQALGDLALHRGAKALDALLATAAASEVDPSTGGEPTVDLLLDVLHSWQDAFVEVAAAGTGRRGGRSAAPADPAEVAACAELGTAVVEALARLVAVNEFRQAADERRGGEATALEDGEVLRLLAHLLLLQFAPATEPAARLRQCLTVFFESFAGLSGMSQQYLATALLPAARCAVADDIAAGRRTAAASPLAPQVVRFALQLLQVPVVGPGGRREPIGHEPLAGLVLGEVLGCARRPGVPKPYLAALCKVPLGLPMFDAGEDTRIAMRRVVALAAHAAELLPDRVMRKDMEAVRERYALPQAEGQAELSGEEIAALLGAVKRHVEEFCSGYPMPFGEEGGAGERKGGRRPAAAAGSDDDGGDGDAARKGDAAAPARRLPARANRTTKAMAESSDEEVAPAQRQPSAAPAVQPDDDSSSEEESSSSEEESSSDEEGGIDWEGDEAENATRRLGGKTDARRASSGSAKAPPAPLREALQENRVS